MACRRIELALIAALLVASPVRADEASEAAGTAFKEGTALVVEAKWAEALAAFERADKLKPHAVTMYNVGACERALGRYTRARAAFRLARERHDKSGLKELPADLVEATTTYLAEIDKLLVRVKIELVPDSAKVLVDGRPLQWESADLKVAGVRPAGPAESPGAGSFVMLVDPGAHVMLLSREGFGDAVVNRTFASGSSPSLRLELDRLPATLQISADRPGALVTVDGKDLGPAPVDVMRPPGTLHVVVSKAGFTTYASDVTVKAGQVLKVHATLPEDKPAITTKWWFWTGAAVIVSGVAVGTWYLTRPAPTRPEVDGGTLGWRVDGR